MYTQCPACKTVFKLRPEQLNAAQGQVRCSRCHTVFNAVANLFQQTTTQSVEEETSPAKEVAPVELRDEPVVATATISSADKETAASIAMDDLADTFAHNDTETPWIEHHKSGQELDIRDDSWVHVTERTESELTVETDLTSLSEPQSLFEEQTAESFPIEQKGDLVDKSLQLFPDESSQPSTYPMSELEEEIPLEPSSSNREEGETPAATDEEETFGEDLLSLFDEVEREAAPEHVAEPPLSSQQQPFEPATGFSTPERDSETSVRTKAGPSPQKESSDATSWDLFSEENINALLKASQNAIAADAGVNHREEESWEPLIGGEDVDLYQPQAIAPKTAVADDEQPHPEENEEEQLKLDSSEMKSDIPPETATAKPFKAGGRLNYSLPLEQEAKKGGSLFGTMFWGIGILFLLAGLGLEYIYYHRIVLVENPQLRPVLEQMCRVTGCQLPPRRDLSKIVLGNHLVQQHPRYEGSLLITATLVNRADFNQPFPIVEVIMTDLEQKVVAHRRFLPNDYLVGNHAAAGLSPGTEVPLMLEVVDPGNNAVGFEFNFY